MARLGTPGKTVAYILASQAPPKGIQGQPAGVVESSPMRLEPGAQFDRYVIEGLLGKGGMGQVYRAFDARLERRVALKILAARSDEPDTDPSVSVRRILREARAAAALDHPNTVAVFEVGEHQGVPFMAMELIQGRSLRTFIGEPSIPLEQRIAWLLEMGKALEAAHRAGIVHLDVKPENVMIRDGGGVKVLDFGVARRHAIEVVDPGRVQAGEAMNLAMLTQGGRLAGTVPYMAPEQIKLQKVDGRTDQFAWGVVAYELLTGCMPWPVDDAFKLVSAILEGAPLHLRELVPELAPDVESVVLRALEKRPMDRFSSMDELVFTLGEVAPPFRPLRSILPSSVTPVPGRVMDKAFADTRLDSQIVDELFEPTIQDVNQGSSRTPAPPLLGTLPALDVGRSTLPSGAPNAPKDVPDEPQPAPRAAQGTPPPVANTERPPAEPKRARRALAALAATALAVGAILIGKGLPSEAPATIAVASVASVAPPAPTTVATAITDGPPPSGCDARAVDAYRAGLQALRDGIWDQAHTHFERAAMADESCAAVTLRLAITGFYYYPISKAREVYQRAMMQRAALGERDRLVLEALDPLIRSDPSNAGGSGERFAALSERFPGDAEIAFLAARLTDEPARKIKSAERAIALDERYSDAWQMLAEGLAAERKVSEALDALERCVNAVPGSVDCVRTRAMLQRRTGRCEEAAATARIWIARDPSTSAGYLALAHALAQDGGKAPVEEALRQRTARLPEAERAQRSLYEQALLDALHGQFDASLRSAKELDRLAFASPNLEAHARPSSLLVDILVETGKSAEAGKHAAEALERASAWSSSFSGESLEVSVYSFVPRMLRVAQQAGAIDEVTYERKLGVWAAATMKSRIATEDAVWALSSPMHVDTPAEAKEALASMPKGVRSNGGKLGIWSVVWGPYAGRALFLDGQVDRAIEQLRDSTAACNAFLEPFLQMRAHLWLGEALESKGDREAACRAYAVIARRWGHATPRSVTATAADKRAEALGCHR
jgi:eukaryotic-like serine/threonine-protein kinase